MNKRDTSSDSLPPLILITGMSGAGRRVASAALEELGWYVAENLPPELIVRMAEMSLSDESPIERLAIVTDVRSRAFAGSLTDVLNTLNETGRRPVVLFLDATDQALIRRYDTVRRTHPLQGEGTVQEAIRKERELLQSIRQRADVVLDTTDTSVHDLRRKLEQYFTSFEHAQVRVNLQSFGFKHGVPLDIDMLLDARFLPNPYWEDGLRHLRGTDREISEYVLDRSDAREFVDAALRLITTTLAGYRHEGKQYLSVAVGCTGGHHRSVAVTEELAARLKEQGVTVVVEHRDIERH